MRATTKKSNPRYYKKHHAMSMGIVNKSDTNSARVGAWRKSTEPNIQDIKSGQTRVILNVLWQPSVAHAVAVLDGSTEVTLTLLLAREVL